MTDRPNTLTDGHDHDLTVIGHCTQTGPSSVYERSCLMCSKCGAVGHRTDVFLCGTRRPANLAAIQAAEREQCAVVAELRRRKGTPTP